jgi:heptosyltransferase-3
VREESIERVAFVFPGALGDFLLALPTLRALRARHAAATATLVVSDPLVPLARLAGLADDCARLDGAESAGLFGGDTLPRWLPADAGLYSWLGADDADVRRRVAARTPRATFLRVERADGATHAAVAYARAAGVDGDPGALRRRAHLDAPPSAWCDALVASAAAPLLVVHAGAGARRKRWAAAGFAAVAAWWSAAGGAVVEVVGPAEGGERAVPGAPMALDPPLPDLAALLAREALYVGNDSGVSHLAGAVGASGAVVFGATRAARWRPISPRLAALQGEGATDDGLGVDRLDPARVIATLAALRSAVAVDKGGPQY